MLIHLYNIKLTNFFPPTSATQLEAGARNRREEDDAKRVSTMPDQTTTKVPAVRGRPFAKGNSGRRPGSKNQSTLILVALSCNLDQDDQEKIQ